MRLAVSVFLSLWILPSFTVGCEELSPPSPTLISRCSGLCGGLWWDEYRHRPLRVQEYWRSATLPDGRIGSTGGERYLEALDASGNRVETLWEVSRTNISLNLFFVAGGRQLIIVSTDGSYSCATTTVYLHDLQWPTTRSDVLLEPSEVPCFGESRGPEHPGAMDLPQIGNVVPSEDGRMLANSFSTGRSLTGRTQLIDLDAHKVVAETDGSLMGRVGARSFYVIEPIYTEHYHHIRDFVLKDFSQAGVKNVGRADGLEHVVRGSAGRLLFGGRIHQVDTAQPHHEKPEKQVLEEEFGPRLKAASQGAQRPAFPCQVLNSLNAWQETSGEVVVAVEERCDGKNGYALYRLPKP